MYDYDSRFWKLKRFVKDEEILAEFESWLKNNYLLLV
jgi:hypothetical protein